MVTSSAESELDIVRPGQLIDHATKYVCVIETPDGPRIIARPGRIKREVNIADAVRKNLVPGINTQIQVVTQQSMSGTGIPEAMERYEVCLRELQIHHRKVVAEIDLEAYKQRLSQLEARVGELESNLFVRFVCLVDIGGIYRKVEGKPESYDRQSRRMNLIRREMPVGTHWEVKVVPEHLVTEVPFISTGVLYKDAEVEYYLDQHLGTDTPWYWPEDSEGRKQFRHLLEDCRQSYDLTLDQANRLKDVLSCLFHQVILQPHGSKVLSIQGRLSALIVRLDRTIWDKSDKGPSQPQW